MKNSQTEFSRQVGDQETRKLKARRQAIKSIWFGFGMFGIIGWSVAVPTLLGALLGLKLDKRCPSAHSWTLTLIVVGLVIGSLNAWYWMAAQTKEMQADD